MTSILVTRPLEASQQLAAKLENRGLAPIVMPFYTFIAQQPKIDIKAAFSGEQGRKLAVFTSPRAVQFGLSHIPTDQVNDLEFAVVGTATRAELESCGFRVHLQSPAGFTSEDLLRIPGLASRPGKAIIFCAPGGRKTLAEGLADLGWEVSQAMVYERTPLHPETARIEDLSRAEDLISVWTSISALKLAEEYLPETAWEKILGSQALVISARIQHHLRQLGARSVALAAGPGNPALLESILRLTGKRTPD